MIISGILVTARTLENFSSLKIGTMGDLMVLSATIAWATTAIAMRKFVIVYLSEANFEKNRKLYLRLQIL